MCSTNKKNILPVNYPLVTTLPPYAALFTLFSNNDEDLIWAYNYFLQLSFENSLSFYLPSEGSKLFKSCPVIEYCYLEYWLSEKIINTMRHSRRGSDFNLFCDEVNIKSVSNDFMSYVIHAIDKGYYGYLFIDTYEIPAYKAWFQKKHYSHPVFLYGYDIDARQVYIADFFTSKYEFKTASFDEITKGYFSIVSRMKGEMYFVRKAPKMQTELNIRMVKNILNDYISARNTSFVLDENISLPSKDCVFGIGVYDVLGRDLLNGYALLRNYHLLYDHKAILIGLVGQLYKEKRINNFVYYHTKLSQISRKTQLLRNIVNKQLLSRKQDYAAAYHLLKEIASDEYAILDELIMDISPILIKDNLSSDCAIKYLGIDRVTKGAWVGNYGKIGYDIFGYKRELSKNISIQYFNAKNGEYLSLDGLKSYIYIQNFNKNGEYMSHDELTKIFDPITEMFLDATDNDGKCISCVRYGNNSEPFELHVKVDTIEPIKTSLYFMCTEDEVYPSFTIDIINSSSGQLMHILEVDEMCRDGAYICLTMKGSVIMRFNKPNSEAKPYLAGLFFDDCSV